MTSFPTRSFRSTRWSIRWLALHSATLLTTAAPLGASAADYYFSSLGSDTQGNGSQAKPWKSIDKFNQLNLAPGDSALFRAGDQFNGKLYLDSADSGATGNGHLVTPIKIGSYGVSTLNPRAKIVSPVNSEAFMAYNNGGLELSDLEFINGGTTGDFRTNGVSFLSDRTKSANLQRFEHLRVNNVVSHGFGLNGLQVWAHEGVGYDDVQVTNSEFYGNGYSGVYVGATNWRDMQHANVVIDRVSTHNNPGFVSTAMPYTGHGVLLAQTDGGAVQNSVAYNNGLAHGNANVAIWTYQSNAIAIQGNLAYGNRSPGGSLDGGAFDIDGGTTNSVIQYNQSYDNDGAGLLLAQFDGADAMSNNIFRYNLSVNDGRKQYGGITIYGATSTEKAEDALFHNNTIVVDRNVVPNAKGAVWFLGSYHDDMTFINNAFVALNGAPLIAGKTSLSRSTFVGNSYWTDGAPIVLGDIVYSTIKSWSNLSKQERIDGQFVGVSADPGFIDPQMFRPDSYSPLVGTGLTLASGPWPEWVTTLGSRDLGGTALAEGISSSIGAWEIPAADFNGDGHVDGNDLTVWKNAFGATGTAGQLADLDGDGDSDGADFLGWQRLLGFGNEVSPVVAAVPEPATALLAVPLAALAAWRRRRTKG